MSHTDASFTQQPVENPREATLGNLVSDLSTQLPELIRSEIRLAQAELAEKGKRAGIGIGMFSAAGLLAFFGLALLLTTGVLLLDLALPAWAAALIVAALVLPGAGAAALGGRKQVAEVGSPTPQRALEGVKADVATIKGDRRDDSRTPEEIQADIELQREHLAGTIDALAAKLDVKSQAKKKAAEVKDRATDDSGRPRPELVGAAAACRRPDRRVRVVATTMTATQRRRREFEADEQRKPDSPTDLHKRSWLYVAPQDLARVQRRPVHRPGRRTDVLLGARALPGVAGADVDARRLVDEATKAVDTILDVLKPLVAADTLDDHRAGASATCRRPRAPA